MFSIEYWIYLLLYAVGVGLAVALVALGLRRFASMETKSSEVGGVAGAIIGLIAVWGPRKDPIIVMAVALVIIVGYFTIKVLVRKTRTGTIKSKAGDDH